MPDELRTQGTEVIQPKRQLRAITPHGRETNGVKVAHWHLAEVPPAKPKI